MNSLYQLRNALWFMGIALCGFLLGCSEAEQEQEQLIRPIAWMKVESGGLEQVRRVSGTVQAAEEAELSFEVSGKIETVNVKLGDAVKAGDVLATLESASYELNARSAAAELARARSQLTEARNVFTRQANLHEKGYGSQAAYDDAKAALDTATSAVDAAKAQYDLSNKNLDDTQLRAPYDGVVTARFIEPSQQITARQACFAIEGNKGLEIAVLIPENLLQSLDKTHQYTASFPALGDLTLKSRINEIGTRAEAANAFQVTLSIATQHPLLRTGMTAEVDFDFQGSGIITGYQGQVIYVPPTALLAGEDSTVYAFVYDSESQTVNRRVVLPENIIGNTVQVTQGLQTGDIIATAGVEYLYDGQKVRLLDSGPKVFN